MCILVAFCDLYATSYTLEFLPTNSLERKRDCRYDMATKTIGVMSYRDYASEGHRSLMSTTGRKTLVEDRK